MFAPALISIYQERLFVNHYFKKLIITGYYSQPYKNQQTDSSSTACKKLFDDFYMTGISNKKRTYFRNKCLLFQQDCDIMESDYKFVDSIIPGGLFYVTGKDYQKAGRDFIIHKGPDLMPGISAVSSGDL